MSKTTEAVGFAVLLALASAGVVMAEPEAAAEAPAIAAESELQWIDSMPQALKQAKTERKSILVDFTGSDWCPACIHLRDKIFSTPEFADYVRDRFVLLELDYPRDEDKYPEEKKDANESIRVQYDIESFPTVLLLDSNGLPYAQVDGADKNVSGYLPRLEKGDAILAKRSAAWEKVQGTEGLATAQALAAMLDTVPEPLRRHYEKVIAMIIVNDPEDTLGYNAGMATDNVRLQQSAAYEKLIAAGRGVTDIDGLKKGIVRWQAFVQTPNLDKDIMQDAWYQMSVLYAMSRDYEGNLECLKKAYAASPNSERAPNIKKWVEHNEKNLSELLKQQGGAQKGEPKTEEDAAPVDA